VGQTKNRALGHQTGRSDPLNVWLLVSTQTSLEKVTGSENYRGPSITSTNSLTGVPSHYSLLNIGAVMQIRPRTLGLIALIRSLAELRFFRGGGAHIVWPWEEIWRWADWKKSTKTSGDLPKAHSSNSRSRQKYSVIGSAESSKDIRCPIIGGGLCRFLDPQGVPSMMRCREYRADLVRLMIECSSDLSSE